MPTRIKNTPLSLEEKLARIKSLADTLEANDMPLDEAISRYEEAAVLIAECRTALTNAELRIEEVKATLDNEENEEEEETDDEEDEEEEDEDDL